MNHMSNVKYKVMSISVEPEMKDMLENAAKKMGWSVSELLRRLITKHLTLLVNDGDDIPVILRVPGNLKGNTDGLQEWLSHKVDGITKALSTCPEK